MLVAACFIEFNTSYIIEEDYVCNFCAANIVEMMHKKCKGEEEIYWDENWGELSYKEVYDEEAPIEVQKTEVEMQVEKEEEISEESSMNTSDSEDSEIQALRKIKNSGTSSRCWKQPPPPQQPLLPHPQQPLPPRPQPPKPISRKISSIYSQVFKSLNFEKPASKSKKRPFPPSPKKKDAPPMKNVRVNNSSSSRRKCENQGLLGCCDDCSRKWASNQIGGPAKVFEFVKSSKSKPSGLKGSNLIGKLVFTKDDDETEYIVVDEFKDGELLVQKFNEVVGGYGVVLKFSGKRLRDGEEVKKVEKEFKRSYSKVTGRVHHWGNCPKIFKDKLGSLKSPPSLDPLPSTTTTTTPNKRSQSPTSSTPFEKRPKVGKTLEAQRKYTPESIWSKNNGSQLDRQLKGGIRLPTTWACFNAGGSHYIFCAPDDKIFGNKKDALNHFYTYYQEDYELAEREAKEDERGKRKYGRYGKVG
ncbi:hypothetical protein TL16_g10061 [Triparma laevis f. inornata]|uniref:Uncharacterized protein n=2 Tax=Triparma laevis TaxID=1534972 RepID=A0A9W7AXH7_9STRA|nr:hypothetical protein TrLO_g555 [Triparma laevis f. longispina]GMH84897.1 hypothetical protein TL16_g10061 [Triparma laevis f. inornata]